MKKLLAIGIVLVLLITILTPANARAAKPTSFYAQGYVYPADLASDPPYRGGITTGTVFPSGGSGRFIVVEREISGVIDEGSINGLFVMNYKANVELLTQAGTLHGRMKVGEYALNLNGKSNPAEFVGWLVPPSATDPGIPLYQITLDGQWNFIEGAEGGGTFQATAIVIPTPEGHIYATMQGGVTLSGQWQQ